MRLRRSSRRYCVTVLGFLLAAATPLFAAAQENIAPRRDYAGMARELDPFIRHELQQKEIPALSIALVDNQTVVWAQGFGLADPEARIPATAETVYRVGSVSKLFTDMALMRLVEQGKLDLDAPVTRYLPGFQPNNPFGGPITIRELTSHRSGLTREPPVGHYFDDTEPTLGATVDSLNSTALIYPPGSRTKYSNAGIAVLGYLLEKTAGKSFYRYLKEDLLEPMGLSRSAFQPLPELQQRLARSFMWSYDGKRFEAPTFQLGMGPAGSLYTTVKDLARFEEILFRGGSTPDGRVILKPKTLKAMWTPQFAEPGRKRGYGIGFRIGEMEGHRTVGHGGAIYGFATTLRALPDDKLGVVVVATLDGANTTTDRVSHAALRLMLRQREHKPLPELKTTTDLEPGLALKLAGRYLRDGEGFDLREFEGKLYLNSLRGGTRAEIRSLGETLIVDDRLAYGTILVPMGGKRLKVGENIFTRVEREKPEPAADEYTGLIGEYGWDFNTLYVLEKDGRLWALIEWFFEYPLEKVGHDVYRFPDWGLYDGQRIVFRRAGRGTASVAVAATVPFKRRPLPGDDNAVSFQLDPVRPVSELRKEAIAAHPPAEKGEFKKPDLVELQSQDPTIRYEIRYATRNNFMGTPFYQSSHAFLQRPAAEAVARANRVLRRYGYGLLIHDAYRPWFVTKMFWDGTPADKHAFVADPTTGSRHNRGSAVDLTLYDLKTGKAARMTGGYDEMSERSYPNYPGGTSLQRWQRDLLRHVMEAEGFQVYRFEWWHFDAKDWRHYPILNLTFEELVKEGN